MIHQGWQWLVQALEEAGWWRDRAQSLAPPVLLLSWVAAASLGYSKLAVSQLTDVERFQGDQVRETPRPRSPLASPSLGESLQGKTAS